MTIADFGVLMMLTGVALVFLSFFVEDVVSSFRVIGSGVMLAGLAMFPILIGSAREDAEFRKKCEAAGGVVHVIHKSDDLCLRTDAVIEVDRK